MLGLILPAALFVLLGVVQGGSLARWSAIHVRWWPLAAACLLAQVALFSPLLETQSLIVAYGPWLYVLSLVGVGATLVANARAHTAARLSLTLAALGVALNCLVIVANGGYMPRSDGARSEEHTSELQSRADLVCRLLREKKKKRVARFSQPAETSRRDRCGLRAAERA